MKPSNGLLFLTGRDVEGLLLQREQEVLDAVRDAYIVHARQDTSLPHSIFLRFPEGGRDRIIGLPAFLGGDFNLAGMKWIASIPRNIERGIDRASAAMILNDRETGRPQAILEASVVSAQRTAASAALAARELHGGETDAVSLVGCGLIGFQIVRYLKAVWPDLATVHLWDLAKDRQEYFVQRLEELGVGVEGVAAGSFEEACSASSVLAFATTAVDPHVSSLEACPPGSTVLHVSLRDLEPHLLVDQDNVVDDLDHVCRAQTSVHLASEEVGHQNFVRASLGDLLLGRAEPKADREALTIFSPFGLGILDLAVAALACREARETGEGLHIPEFLPDPWMSAWNGNSGSSA